MMKYINIRKKTLQKDFITSFLQLAETILFDSSFPEKKSDILAAVKRINNSILFKKPLNSTAVNIRKIISDLSAQNDFENALKLFCELKNQICTKTNTIKKTGYLNSHDFELEADILLTEKFFNELKYFVINPNHGEIELELAHFGKELIYFFNKTLELYSAKKKENGFLDFEDILLISFELLKKEEIRKSLSEKFKYIMIDEYQDTNEVQYKIFLPILDYLKKGNLFVVGDEKQSIYMFRDAELEVFFRTKKEIEQSSGKENILSLPESFRMASNLCVFTNFIFRKLFSNSKIKDNLFNEVEHSELVCAREDDIQGKVEILITEKSEEKHKQELESGLIAKRILNLINDPKTEEKLKWSDIAILSRKRKNFNEIETTFVKYKIPFSIVGGKGFYQKQSIYDIFNYFSFLLDSNNSTALIGILRAPFFSISDSEIFEISLEKGNNYWQKFQNYSITKPNYKNAVNILSDNINLVNNIDIPVLLRKILNETAFLPVLAAKPNGVQESANIEKLIKLTINFSLQGFSTLYDYVNFLKDSIDKIEDEAQAAVSDESNSVKIMTLHQAKGLEFPVVFLFKCDEGSMPSGIKSKEIFVDKKLGILTKLPVNENYFSEYQSAPIIGAGNYISSKKNISELKRLFYVGVTRAKDYLFISAEEKENYPKDSFMGLLSDVFDFKSNPQSFQLNEKLKLLEKKGDKYIDIEREISFEIPVIKKIENFIPNKEEKEQNESEKKISVYKVEDKSENEIISATKISVFKQCPLKYQLTYEFGFSPILNQYKNWFRSNTDSTYYEFSNEEDIKTGDPENIEQKKEQNISADIKGKIIHSILQNELSLDLIEDFTKRELKNEIELLNQNEESLSGFAKEIVSDLENLYSSEIFQIFEKEGKV